jgi:hypothetical protein
MRNIEDLFKKSLKDHELPYDKKAWSELSKKLDARNPGASNGVKWIFGVAVIAVLVTTYLFVSSNEASKERQAELTQIEDAPADEINNEDLIKAPLQNDLKSTDQKADKEFDEEIYCGDEAIVEQNTIFEEQNVISEASTELQQPVYREVAIEPRAKDETKSALYFAKVKDYCLNSEFSYSNVNDKSIYLLSPLDNLEEISAKETFDVTLDEKGKYQIGTLNQDQEFKEFVSFMVHQSSVIQLTAKDYLDFENGLPELNVQAFSDHPLDWTLNGEKIAQKSNSENFYLFDKGSYIIKASTTDVNGCQIADQVNFYVEKNYNLLAVNAFTPNSMDQRNTSFMPYALTKRDAAFKMIIIDPSNGAVIFETMNADQPWTGINKNTGELVEDKKSYVWKVVLQNPEKGESPEYMGTVIRL